MNIADPVVSVIVPVYNAERYLSECVDSLRSQTLQEAEFIFIDDGSSDGSNEILNKAKSEDDRISIIKQQNAGAAAARNNGIRNAKGRYLIFLDADDWFDFNMIESMSKLLDESDADICEASFYMFDEADGSSVRYEKPYGNLTPGIFCRSDIQADLFSHWGAPWNKMFKRAFVLSNDIVFQNLPNTNDIYFVYRSLLTANKTVVTDDAYVHYRWNSGSSLQDGKVKHPLCTFQAASELRAWALQSGLLSTEGKKSLDWMCFSVLVSGMRLSNVSAPAARSVYEMCSEAFEKWGIQNLPHNYFDGVYRNLLYECVAHTSFRGLVRAFGVRKGARYQSQARKALFALSLIICRLIWAKK